MTYQFIQSRQQIYKITSEDYTACFGRNGLTYPKLQAHIHLLDHLSGNDSMNLKTAYGANRRMIAGFYSNGDTSCYKAKYVTQEISQVSPSTKRANVAYTR